MPLRAIRTRLRLIRYYSAPRPYGRWNQALDVAMVAALVLACGAAWILDRTWARLSEPQTVTGMVYREPGGRLWAWTAPPAVPDDLPSDVALHGAYRVDVTEVEHGWPFVSSRGFREAAMNVELFDEGRSLAARDLPEDSPLRAAIARELNDEGHGAVAEALWGGRTDLRALSRRPGGWAANWMVWSFALVIAAWLAVGAGRLAAAVLRTGHAAHRRRLARGGRCAACGYDLRASAYSDRCPECGMLQEPFA